MNYNEYMIERLRLETDLATNKNPDVNNSPLNLSTLSSLATQALRLRQWYLTQKPNMQMRVIHSLL